MKAFFRVAVFSGALLPGVYTAETAGQHQRLILTR